MLRLGIRRLLETNLVLLIVGLLVSFSVSAQSVTHLTNASHSESWLNHLKAMAEEFKEQTGISVEVRQSTGNYAEQVLVMRAGGVIPDVTDFSPVAGASLIESELFEDLRPYAERSGLDLTQFPTIAVDGVTSPRGTLWSFPVSVYPVVTFFNGDLFQNAGLVNPIDLGEDWTWETFRESSRLLTVDKDGDANSDQWGVERLTSRWEQWVHQAGGQLFDRLILPTESRLNSSEILETARFLAGLSVDDQVVAPSGSAYLFRSGNGNVAMTTVDGPGIIGTFLQDISFEWDIARQPRGPVNRSAQVSPDGFQILKESGNKDAAWRWVHFLVGNVENQVRFAATTGRVPSMRQAMLQYDQVPLTLPANWMAFIDTAFDPDGFAAYVVPSDIRSTITSTMNTVWRGERSPEEALEQLHDLVNAMLAERGE